MPPSPTLVILPGLDGTGLLLDDFCNALAARGIASRIITYPTDRALGYDALQRYVTERLPEGDYTLLGESFSGPIALRIAAAAPSGLKAVVLAASFARFMFPFKRTIATLAALLPPRLAPFWLFDFLLMNGKATADQKRALRAALASVAPEVLQLRMREAVNVDLAAEGLRIRVPLLYLRAEHDRLMRPTSGESVLQLAVDGRFQTIAAPHFIFQNAPEECAAVVLSFYATTAAGVFHEL